jgi:DnaK suppressor protein
MKPKTIEFFFKTLLIGMLYDIQSAELKDDVSMNKSGVKPHDLLDKVLEETSFNFSLKMKERNKRLERKVKESLRRLENGTYGICESCGDDISQQRLAAWPVSTLCIDCKRKEEEVVGMIR